MFTAIKGWFLALSTISKVGVVTASVVTAGVVGGSVGTPSVRPTPSVTPNTLGATTTPTKPQPVITHKTVTDTKTIPFTSTSTQDGALALGQTAIRTAGVNGTETLTYDVTYRDGVETARTLVSDVNTTPPVGEVIAKGTYVAPTQPSCPNGTYNNSSGNTVCRPYESNTAPAGATAQCRDGTYSFSQHRSGTCSYHGGVATWL